MQSVSATLEATLDDRGSITGTLRGTGDEPVAFTSWLGLVGAINELAGRSKGEGASPATRSLDLLEGGTAPRPRDDRETLG